VPSYLVETHLARGKAGERASREQRARAAAEELMQKSVYVRFERSIHVPKTRSVSSSSRAPSGRDAALVAGRAGLDPFRVVEAVSSDLDSLDPKEEI
jgi:hypothetical protein